MIYFAFKVAASTDSFFSHEIARVTRNPFCHVEIVLDATDPGRARCFSSREGHGAGFALIDIRNQALWEIIQIPCTPEQELLVRGYCMGADGKAYDYAAIPRFVAVAAGHDAIPELHDFRALFCSECAADVVAKCLGKSLGGKHPWVISPGMLHDMAVGFEFE